MEVSVVVASNEANGCTSVFDPATTNVVSVINSVIDGAHVMLSGMP